MPGSAQVISAAVVPVVIISACALLCLALSNRLTAIISRLRAFQRERLHEQERLVQCTAARPQDVDHIRHLTRLLASLAEQTRYNLQRARLVRATMLSLLSAIGLLLLCSMAAGLSTLWPHAAWAALAFFALGLLAMLLGVGLALAETWLALRPVEYESAFVSELLDERRLPPAAQDDPL